MGFFSKVWKGIKTGVKSIGKGIKKAFKKFGKFMGEIGILGQVAMMFILPGIGEMIGSAWSGIAGQTAAQAGASATAAVQAGTATASQVATAAKVTAGGQAAATGLMGVTGAFSGVANAAGKLMQFVGKSVGTAGNAFNNVTKGITDTLTNFSKTATNNLANKIGMDNVFEDAASNFFGPGDSAFSRSFGETSRFQRLGTSQDVFAAEKQARLDAIDFEKKFPTTKPKAPLENINLDTATGGVVDPSAEALKSNQVIGEGTFGQYKGQTLSRGTSNNNSLLSNFNEQSTFDKIKDIPSKIYDASKEKVTGFIDDPAGTIFEGFDERLNQGVQTTVMQGLGLEDKPEYTYNTMRAYVPEFQVASLEGGGSEPIMSARAFEQNVTNNQNPFGYTAFQYGQYMSQFGQTA